MAKVYLAAPYGAMQRMRDWKVKLEERGHVITSRWINGNEEGMTLADAAQIDLDDVNAADAVVSFALAKGTAFTGGGRHVEFGYGLARGKLMVVVAPNQENIFHHLECVLLVPDIESVLTHLDQP